MSITEFFRGGFDYIVFIYGFAMIAAGVACFNIKRVGDELLPWGLLSTVSAMSGIVEWMSLISYGAGNPNLLFNLRWLIVMAVYLGIAEFGRRGTRRHLSHGPSPWVRAAMAIVFAGFVICQFGSPLLKSISSACLYTLAELWAAVALLLASRNGSVYARRYFRTGWIALCIHAIVNGVLGIDNVSPQFTLVSLQLPASAALLPLLLIRLALVYCCVIAAWSYSKHRKSCSCTLSGGKYITKDDIGLLVVLLIIFTCGWVTTIFAGRQADRQFRSSILSRAITASAAIDPMLVAGLSGKPSDAAKPEFTRVVKQLRAIKRADPSCRFVYLMGRKHNNIVFLADAEPPSSSSYSAPGDMYSEAGQWLIDTFTKNKANAVGPHTDSWGTWMTGVAPIHDFETGRVIAIIGMDVSLAEWISRVAYYRCTCIIITLLLCAVVMVSFLIVQSKEVWNAKVVESELRYRSLVECSCNCVALFDNGMCCVTMNKTGTSALGYSEDGVLGQKLQDIWPISDDTVMRVMQGERCVFEVERSGNGCSVETWYLALSPIPNECDGFSGLVGIATNITERKRAENALRRSEENLKKERDFIAAILETAGAIVSVIDRHGRIVRFNHAAEELSGYSFEELKNAYFWDTPMASEDGDIIGQAFTADIDLNGVSDVCESVWLTRWNGRRLISWSNTALRDEDGRIEHIVAIGADVTEKRTYEERLDHLAHHDALTGLPNRLLFGDCLTQRLAEARRYDRQLAVIFIDLDRFKLINDTLGHNFGDQLLKSTSMRLASSIREVDTLARMGGDEFTVILSQISSAESVVEIAERIMAALAEPFVLNNRELFVSASIGISLYPSDGVDAETLVKNADTAMYRAKEQGRSNYQFYTKSLNTAAVERMTLETSLRKALERNEFMVYYQPRVDLQTGATLGAEALIRWQHPEMGLVSPASFIPLAEETGLILPIGEWVLETACAQNKAWQEAGLPHMDIAVNISARQFFKQNLADMIGRALDKTGLEPRYLDLELTESALMQNAESAAVMLQNLKDMGVRVSIDDFGTGYSSLSYLKRFPIDAVKIDRSFINDITSNPDDAAIARAVVAMAHSLRLKVIAEGVETIEQLTFLRSLRCDEIQGYFISCPVPASEFEQHLIQSAAEENSNKQAA